MSNYVQTTFFAPKDSLLTGNPAKLIKGADVDPELAAIAAAITSKYDATNISSAPVLFNDGTVAAPGIAFAADTNTGFYRIGADDLGIATAGVLRVTVGSSGNIVIAAPDSATTGLTVNGLGAGRAALFQGGTNPNIGVTDGTVTSKVQIIAATKGVIGTESNHEFDIYTNNISRIAIAATGAVTINAPSSGTALAVTGAASSYVYTGVASGNSGQSFGINIRAGTTAGDRSLLVQDSTALATYFTIFGDGHGTLGPTSALGLSWTAAGALTQTGTALITSTLQVNGTTVACGGAASGYVVTPNYSFQNAGATNLAVRDTTDSTEGLFRADSTGIIFGAASNHSLFIRTNNATVISVGTAGGVQFGAPTGGDKGAGTLNVAGGLYINNVAVGTSSAVGANPTATVGTAAVNGSSANFMRADGAPAIDLTMVPSWSGAHTFTHVVASSGSSGDYPVFLKAAIPYLAWSATGQAADAKVWETMVNGLTFTGRIANDAGSTTKNWLAVLRAANVVSSLSFGNATDNPTYSFLGTGAATFSGTVTGLSFIPTSSTVPANGLYLAAANTLGFAANSVNIARMTSTAITGLGPVAAAQVDMTPDSSSWTTTLSGGYTANPTGTLKWRRVGNLVMITADAAITGTSNANTDISCSALPASITPGANRLVVCTVTDGSTTQVLGQATVQTGGTILLQKYVQSSLTVTANSWVTTLTKGIPAGWSIWYLV